jgi:hypothetical protein
MQAVPRIVAFALVSSLLMLSVLGADDKDKKTDAPKDEGKKADVKKDEPAKKEEPANKGDEKKPISKGKMPAPKGKLRGYETDPAAAEKKMLRQSKVAATVVVVVEDKKTLRLRITIPYIKINAGALNNYYNAQMNLMRQTSPQGILNAQNNLLRAESQIYQQDKIDKEVEWTAADEFKVRAANPPPLFDEKGRPKRYTRKELQELRGNDRLPGFPAEFSDIKAGQIVQVTLLQNKAGARPARRSRDAGGDASADNLPKMSLIIIVADPKN